MSHIVILGKVEKKRELRGEKLALLVSIKVLSFSYMHYGINWMWRRPIYQRIILSMRNMLHSLKLNWINIDFFVFIRSLSNLQRFSMAAWNPYLGHYKYVSDVSLRIQLFSHSLPFRCHKLSNRWENSFEVCNHLVQGRFRISRLNLPLSTFLQGQKWLQHLSSH